MSVKTGVIVNSNLKAGLNKFSFTGLFCVLFISFTLLSSQQNPTENRQGRKIFVESADLHTIHRSANNDMQILSGNVIFRHDSVYMYCDSAYLYPSRNTLEAFSNVLIEQGDSLFMYSDYAEYDGNLSLAKMRENVRMENNDMVLYTDFFDYDRIADIAYFFEGGTLVDSINELVSSYGQYSPNTKIATFKDDVVLTNPQYLLTTDTLIYNTTTKVASIVSISVIEADSGVIYANRGYYNTLSDEAELFDRSVIISNDGSKNITGDTLFYNRLRGFGEAYGNMLVNDTVRKIIVAGDYGYYDDLRDFTFATDSAYLVEYSRQDSLFLHADSLIMETIGDARELRAFHGVRYFHPDFQGVCDSMQFNSLDSILYMFKNPVIWNTGYQIVGDTIKMYMKDETLDKVEVLGYAFSMEDLDSIHFNQMKGRLLTAYFKEGELNQVYIEGDAESIYYPIEEGKGYVGQNTTQSMYMLIEVKNRKPYKIKWPSQTKGRMIPIPDVTPENKFLKDFVNYNYIRPIDRQDIFRPTVRKLEDIPAPRRHRSRNR